MTVDVAVQVGFRATSAFAGREFVRALRTIPEAIVIVRNSQGILLECNEAFGRYVGAPVSELLGQKAGTGILTPQAGPFIYKFLKPVFEQGMEATHWMLIDGRRHLGRAWPLSEAEWGTTGYAAVIVPMGRGDVDMEAGLDPTSTLGPLGTLTPTELAVLYHFSRGLSRAEIATEMSRSEHTVHEHFKGIHAKLHQSRQQDLAVLTTELGIKWFTREQWRLLTGAPV